MDLPKRYEVCETEKKWQKYWEKKGIFKFPEKTNKPVYSVDTPPPTLSGRMHVGHAFSYTQQDFVIRFQRMKGNAVYYPFGTDDNGLPTERLVENLKKVDPHSMDRSAFVKLCYKTVQEETPRFIQDWKDIGMSCDFSDNYSTISPHSIKTSQSSFIDLYKKGRLIREKSPISWCPKCRTAVAQAEFESKDINSHFNDVVFKVGGKELIIATTRPELLPACVAIVAHPADERYKDLIGKFAKVPLFDYEVPIITDTKADPEKGTGIVMCCTFGDKTDIEWWREHNLPLKIAITLDGKMNKEAKQYEGLLLSEARKKIIQDLKGAGLLIKQEEITHAVNVHERCGVELEFLETLQWFIRVLDKKQELIDAGNQITWWPEHMKVRYAHWVENLNWEWCISRQRFYGVPFPVWYCKKCSATIVAEDEDLPVDPVKDKPKNACSCGAKEFEPEKDIMDTWATSSLTPQIVLNWVGDKSGYSNKIPMGLRPQAHDIIRTWAFYTIAKSIFHHGKVPWKNIVISGHVKDPHWQKMSKSKGNIVDPRKILAEYGADVLRYWAAGSKLGEDLAFMEKDLVTGKKLVTKLWNASKFVFSHIEDFDLSSEPKLELFDKWMLSKLQETVLEATEAFNNYDYAKARHVTEQFFWHILCDYYLEIVKDRLYDAENRGVQERRSAQYVLYHCLLAVLKMFAPILPHVTEELYQIWFANIEGKESIHIADWPEVDKGRMDKEISPIGDLVISVVEEVRKAKTAKTVSLKEPVKELKVNGEITAEQFVAIEADLKGATRAEKILYTPGKEELKCEIKF